MGTKEVYKQCLISVMDNIADPDITFDEKGISNYYYEFNEAFNQRVKRGEEGEARLSIILDAIKENGKGKEYDCIMGLSGGVDSSYVAYLAKKNGLRPLAVHFDNGWNSELAVKNVENIVNTLGFDLHTLVVDWEEFRDLQLAYIKASVIDIELVTDHAITATLAKLAKKYKISYILSGSNVVTEYTMPPSWIFNKTDHINLLDIHKKYGTSPLKSYPLFDTYLKKYFNDYLKVEIISILNFVPYNKRDVKEIISKEFGWRDYGGKHYESIFTKFYQAYILPTKFKVDKRKAHLSNLIFSNQITKEAALEELSKPIYPENEFKHDYDFVLKKFGLTDSEFSKLMNLPPRSHLDFAVETSFFNRYPFLKILRPLAQVAKGFKTK